MIIPKTAMLLAAGLGTRMLPITKTIPKPMVKVLNRSLINHILDRLIEVGVRRVIVNLYYQGERLRGHLSHRDDIEILFSEEKERLETGGGIVNALNLIGKQPFFVINTDSLWLDGPAKALERLSEEWKPKTMDGILLLHSTVNAHGYRGLGDFVVTPDGVLFRRPESYVSPWLFTGIQILHPRVFKGVSIAKFSLNIIYNQVIEKERLFGCIHDGEWFHIGTPKALEEAELFLGNRYSVKKHR